MSLGIAAWIITDLQRRFIENNKILKVIVLTETIGLTLLLIPTGGISSPFMLLQSANTTMKELRAAIYSLSSVKKGEQPF